MARPKTDLATEKIDDNLIVLDRQRNQVHKLNATASLVWHGLVAKESVEAIADKLVNQFDASRSIALKDVQDLIAELDSLGLLEMGLEPPESEIKGGEK